MNTKSLVSSKYQVEYAALRLEGALGSLHLDLTNIDHVSYMKSGVL